MLNLNFLFYYKTLKDVVPTGVICLRQLLDKKGEWIALESMGRTYLLQAESKEDAIQWKRSLRHAITGYLISLSYLVFVLGDAI